MPNDQQKRKDRQMQQKEVSDYISKKQAQQKAKAKREDVNQTAARAAGSN